MAAGSQEDRFIPRSQAGGSAKEAQRGERDFHRKPFMPFTNLRGIRSLAAGKELEEKTRAP